VIHFYHVTKRFDQYSTALHDITFHIEKGEFVFLTGASGAYVLPNFAGRNVIVQWQESLQNFVIVGTQ